MKKNLKKNKNIDYINVFSSGILILAAIVLFFTQFGKELIAETVFEFKVDPLGFIFNCIIVFAIMLGLCYLCYKITKYLQKML